MHRPLDVLQMKEEDVLKCLAVGTHSEKAMEPHSSTLAWKIPRTAEPGRLQTMGSLKARHC